MLFGLIVACQEDEREDASRGQNGFLNDVF
jgi:hypothetical protein